MITIRQRRKLQHVQVAVAVSKANSCIVCVHVSSVLVGDQARQLFLGVEEGGGRRKGMPEGQGQGSGPCADWTRVLLCLFQKVFFLHFCTYLHVINFNCLGTCWKTVIKKPRCCKFTIIMVKSTVQQQAQAPQRGAAACVSLTCCVNSSSCAMETTVFSHSRELIMPATCFHISGEKVLQKHKVQLTSRLRSAKASLLNWKEFNRYTQTL